MTLEGGKAKLDLRPVSSLLPHEETIPDQLTKIAAQVKRDGVQKDPIIVDRESGAVLDGMHRLGAFARLGFGNIVCYLVDYSSSEIGLGRWARVYRTNRTQQLHQAVRELGFTDKVTLASAFEMLESRKAPVAVMGAAGSFVQTGGKEIQAGFSTIRKLDSLGAQLGWRRSFVREDEIDVALQDAENVVLLVQRLTKQDVLNAARSGRLFPCKTSLHTIDPRPVALNFPLADLDSASPKRFAALMASRKQKTLPPDSLYEGRRYKERLLVLDQD